jgi:hypothetical protein
MSAAQANAGMDSARSVLESVTNERRYWSTNGLQFSAGRGWAPLRRLPLPLGCNPTYKSPRESVRIRMELLGGFRHGSCVDLGSKREIRLSLLSQKCSLDILEA